MTQSRHQTSKRTLGSLAHLPCVDVHPTSTSRRAWNARLNPYAPVPAAAPPSSLGNLSVTIARSANLINLESFSVSDRLLLRSGWTARAHRTPVADNTINRTTRQQVNVLFRVENATGALKFHVMNKNTVSDDFMGEGFLPINARWTCEEALKLRWSLPLAAVKRTVKFSSQVRWSQILTVDYQIVSATVERRRRKAVSISHLRCVLPCLYDVAWQSHLDYQGSHRTQEQSHCLSDPYCVITDLLRTTLTTPKASSTLNRNGLSTSQLVLRLVESYQASRFMFTVFDSNF